MTVIHFFFKIRRRLFHLFFLSFKISAERLEINISLTQLRKHLGLFFLHMMLDQFTQKFYFRIKIVFTTGKFRKFGKQVLNHVVLFKCFENFFAFLFNSIERGINQILLSNGMRSEFLKNGFHKRHFLFRGLSFFKLFE